MLMVCFKCLSFMIYTNKFINSISFIITIIVFFLVHFLFFDNNIPISKVSSIISEINVIENKKDEDKDANFESKKVDLGNWYIEIPTINLSAPIGEGTDSGVLNNKVGHFIDTPTETGNIGLAAHNRGYEYNYFQNLKKLKKEDKIIYIHENLKRVYFVDKIEIIENSDWSYLKNTDDNRITLITCVENEPKYRRCIQGKELED